MSNGPVQSKQIDDLLAFPVLTQEIGTAGTSRPGAAATPGTAPLAQLVENTLRNVLGWRPRTGDSKGFLAALQQSFSCKDVEGHMECRWTPRGAAIGIQADLGAITGAQASLYARARNTLDQVLPLLDGLRSLESDSDVEDSQSARIIVRTALAELVDETGRLGGPRVARVDELFLLLLGPFPDPAHPENVGGHLQLLRDRFGLTAGLVGTVDEERVLTDFLLIVDYVSCLQQAWTTQRSSFLRGNSAFLGTQLVLLSRELAVAGEAVQELYAALDSVFVGAAERETVVLEFGSGQPPLTVAELFSWVERFVSLEGPRLLQDAGKDGVTAFRSTLSRLEDLVEEAEAIARRNSSNPVSGYHTVRVANQIDGLLAALRRARKLSAAVGRIAVEEVFPPVGRPGLTSTVTISGHGFEAGAAVSFGPGITVGQVQWIDADHLAVPVTIPSGAPAAAFSVTVVNPRGHGTATLPEAFRVLKPLEATGVTPDNGPAGDELTVTIHGNGFDRDAWVDFGRGILVQDVRRLSDTRLEATLQIRPNTIGVKNVTVTASDGASETLPLAFTVTTNPVEIQRVSLQPPQGDEPPMGPAGASVTLLIEAGPLGANPEVELAPSRDFDNQATPPASVTVAAADVKKQGTALLAPLTLPNTPGRWDVIVRSGSASRRAQSAKTLPAGFLVLPQSPVAPPDVQKVDPGEGQPGEILTVTVSGNHLQSSDSVLFGKGILVTGITPFIVSGKMALDAKIEILPAAEGTRHVTVTHLDGQSDTLENAFTVLDE